ncbi:MAG: ABC transporter permease [Acidobacteria bacterium]|nr:ABC transporter permease [Acidobacteriota bacterium]
MKLRVLLSEYFVLYLSAAYFLALWPFVPEFASGGNLANIFSNMLPLLVVAIGQTFVMISGGIDLSVTSVIALASTTGALVMTGDGGLLAGTPWAIPAGVAVMLLIGLSLGLLNGVAVTRLRMPPFIVTLTVMMFFSGLAIWLTKSRNIYNLPAPFTAVGRGTWSVVAVAGALTVLAHLTLRRSLFGRWLYAVGSNPRTSLVSGVPVRRTILSAYVVCGLCAAVAAILYTGRLETGSPVLGQRILLDVIGATVIGGTSLFGGRGKVAWTVCGVLFMSLIDNSLNLLGLSNFMVLMAKGLVILLAALLDAARKAYAER